VKGCWLPGPEKLRAKMEELKSQRAKSRLLFMRKVSRLWGTRKGKGCSKYGGDCIRGPDEIETSAAIYANTLKGSSIGVFLPTDLLQTIYALY